MGWYSDRCLHRVGVIVRALASTTMNNMHTVVTAGLHNRRKTLLGDAHECMWGGTSRAHSANGNSHRTVGAILEANGQGDTQCKLEVELRLGCAHVNGTPGDERCEAL